MDAALSEALVPVLRDLDNSGGPRPEVRDRQWSDVPGQVTAMLHRPDGGGQGVFAMAGEPLPDRIASVADQVQEWAVEALWRTGRPATWPECPGHPGTHPLAAALRGDRAVWTCPRTGNLIGAVGELTGPSSSKVWDMAELFHITERTVWLDALRAGEYRMSTRGVTLEQEGYIHCSLSHQLRGVAEYLYSDADDLVVLVIDSAKVPAPIRREAPGPGSDEEYPHIYGALPVEAVTSVITVNRDPAGRLVLPG